MKRCDVTVCNIIKNMNKIMINCKMLKCLFFVQSNLKSTVAFNETKNQISLRGAINQMKSL